MKPIVSLALNPTIDSSCEADVVRPILKVRTREERYDPGGGGVNVARVIRELGGEALVVYLAGGLTGNALTEMLGHIGLPSLHIPIQGATRVSHVVFETSSGQEYRFTPEGPELAESEWRACLAALGTLSCDYLVATGSLPRGVPADFYARVARQAKEKGARVVLDTTGEALTAALEEGVFLVKPNLRELESAFGCTLRTREEQEEAARSLAEGGKAEVVTVSLGAGGGLLVTDETTLRLTAPWVTPRSAVGAGDAFVAALTLGLARGWALEEAFTWAVAAGTAAVLTPGTELCLRADVERIVGELEAAA